MRREIGLALALAVLPAHADVIPAGCGGVFAPTLVYTRQPRAQAPVGTMSDAANWQHANDISRVWAQSEADVVLDSNGAITVIHDYIRLGDRKSTRLNSSHRLLSRMPSSA